MRNKQADFKKNQVELQLENNRWSRMWQPDTLPILKEVESSRMQHKPRNED